MKVKVQEQGETTGSIKDVREMEFADYKAARHHVSLQNTNYKGVEEGCEVYCGLWFEPRALGRAEDGERIRTRYLIPISGKTSPQLRYNKTHVRSFKLDCMSPSEDDLIQFLEGKENKARYIKDLIRADMAKENGQK